jgi:hypothetical protein
VIRPASIPVVTSVSRLSLRPHRTLTAFTPIYGRAGGATPPLARPISTRQYPFYKLPQPPYSPESISSKRNNDCIVFQAHSHHLHHDPGYLVSFTDLYARCLCPHLRHSHPTQGTYRLSSRPGSPIKQLGIVSDSAVSFKNPPYFSFTYAFTVTYTHLLPAATTTHTLTPPLKGVSVTEWGRGKKAGLT